MRVAIYTRVSTIEQAAEGYSLDAQRKTLEDYCRERGYTVVNVYSDEGISAKDIHHRPQMQRLLSDSTANKFDMILVWKLTRFTRSLHDLCAVCDMLDKHNILFVSYSESFDCATPAGRMMRSILGVVAQWEREVIGENVKAALEERAYRGLRTCSYVLGYDTTPDGLKINPKEAQRVRFIYGAYLQYQNIRNVSEICKSKGMTGKKGGQLKPESIHKILTRFIYCGYYSWRRTPILGNFEPIIDIDTYNKVQTIIAQRGLRYGRRRYSGLVYL